MPFNMRMSILHCERNRVLDTNCTEEQVTSGCIDIPNPHPCPWRQGPPIRSWTTSCSLFSRSSLMSRKVTLHSANPICDLIQANQ